MMNEIMLICKHCTEKMDAPIEILINIDQLPRRTNTVLNFLKKHENCGVSDEYKAMIDKINSQETIDKAEQMLDLIEKGTKPEVALEFVKNVKNIV